MYVPGHLFALLGPEWQTQMTSGGTLNVKAISGLDTNVGKTNILIAIMDVGQRLTWSQPTVLITANVMATKFHI